MNANSAKRNVVSYSQHMALINGSKAGTGKVPAPNEVLSKLRNVNVSGNGPNFNNQTQGTATWSSQSNLQNSHYMMDNS